MLASSAYTAPGTIGSGTPNSGAFTTLSASSTVSGTGFSTYLASPPAIGGTTPSTGKFTSITNTGLTATQVIYATTGGLETSSANMTFNGTSLTLANDASISGLTVGRGGAGGVTNTAFGVNALALVGNSGDVGIGNNAGAAKTTTSDTAQSTFVGYYAGAAVNTGTDNTFIGGVTGRNTTTGSNNVALGGYSFFTNTTGSYNTVVGKDALRLNTTASNNTAVGYQAGYLNTTGTQQTLLGYQAGFNLTTQGYNTLIGYQAGLNINGTFGQNCFVGTSSGQSITSGYNNTIIGSYSGNQGGLDIRTASNYIVLSDGAGNPRGIFDNNGNFLVGATTASLYNQNATNGISNVVGTSSNIQISTDPNGSTGNACLLLNMRNTPINGAKYTRFFYNGSSEVGSISLNGTTGVLYNLTSDYRLKDNPQPLTGASEFIMALQPKTWDWWDGSGKGVGFIAHEFMEVAKYSGNGKKDEVDVDGKPVYQSIQPSSSEVMANLVALVQELNAKVTALEAKLGA